MKIRVSLVVEVDPQMWANTDGAIVGVDGGFAIADVRESVRSYLLNLAQCSALIDEAEAEVTLS